MYGFTGGGFFQRFLDDVEKARAEGDELKAQAHNGAGQPAARNSPSTSRA
jgi:hypothetical protein